MLSDKAFHKLCKEAIRQTRVIEGMTSNVLMLWPPCRVSWCEHYSCLHLYSRFCYYHTMDLRGGTEDTFIWKRLDPSKLRPFRPVLLYLNN